GFEGHDGGDGLEDFWEREDEVSGVAVLAQLAIDAGLDGEAVPGVDFTVTPLGHLNHPGADRTEGVESFGPGPLRIGFLQVACGDVVDAGVAQNIGPNVAPGGQLRTAALYDHAQLAFVVHVLRERGEA